MVLNLFAGIAAFGLFVVPIAVVSLTPVTANAADLYDEGGYDYYGGDYGYDYYGGDYDYSNYADYGYDYYGGDYDYSDYGYDYYGGDYDYSNYADNQYDYYDEYNYYDEYDYAYQDQYDYYDEYNYYDQYDYAYQDQYDYQDYSYQDYSYNDYYDYEYQDYAYNDYYYEYPYEEYAYYDYYENYSTPIYYPQPRPNPPVQPSVTNQYQYQNQQQQTCVNGSCNTSYVDNSKRDNSSHYTDNSYRDNSYNYVDNSVTKIDNSIKDSYNTNVTNSFNTQQQTPPPPYYPPVPPPAPQPAPYCVLTANPTFVAPGQPVTLSWTAQNASSGHLNYGSNQILGPSGSLVVYPYTSTNYTATFVGYNGQQVVCSAYVTVTAAMAVSNPNVSLFQTPPQQPLAYVSLSQIPYTGLDLGPWGTAAYWGFLMFWAGLAAYLVVIRKTHQYYAAKLKTLLFGDQSQPSHPAYQVANLVPAFANSVTSAIGSELAKRGIEPGRTAASHPAYQTESRVPEQKDAVDSFVMSQVNRFAR